MGDRRTFKSEFVLPAVVSDAASQKSVHPKLSLPTVSNSGPMDVDAVLRGKGKGKTKGKGKATGGSKGKGKSKSEVKVPEGQTRCRFAGACATLARGETCPYWHTKAELQMAQAKKGASKASAKAAKSQGKGKDAKGKKTGKGSKGAGKGKGDGGKAPRDKSKDVCRRCGKTGHWEKDCTEPKKDAVNATQEGAKGKKDRSASPDRKRGKGARNLNAGDKIQVIEESVLSLAERAGMIDAHQKILSMINRILSGTFQGVPEPLHYKIHISPAPKMLKTRKFWYVQSDLAL